MNTDIDLGMFQKESGHYNTKLRQFATTLKFYSSKAYEHLRNNITFIKFTYCTWLATRF